MTTFYILKDLIKKVNILLPNPSIIAEVVLTVHTVDRIGMVTHEGPLLELGPWWAGEQHPPGHGGANAQQVITTSRPGDK